AAGAAGADMVAGAGAVAGARGAGFDSFGGAAESDRFAGTIGGVLSASGAAAAGAGVFADGSGAGAAGAGVGAGIAGASAGVGVASGAGAACALCVAGEVAPAADGAVAVGRREATAARPGAAAATA